MIPHSQKLTDVVIGSNGLVGGGNSNYTNSSQEPYRKIKCIGFNISRFSKATQFLIVSSGVMGFFILYGYLIESIFSQPLLKSFGLFVTFIQFILYSIFAFIETWLAGSPSRRIPMPTYVVISLLTVTTMGFSNLSLEYLNYPTQVIFKSCKLIPVLLGGIIIQGKKYGTKDFIAAAVMCIGLIWFTLVDVKISPNFHPMGVFMISLALIADSVIGNVQEKAMKKYRASNYEVVLYSYLFGMGYIFVVLLLTRQFPAAIKISQQYPMEMYGYGFLLSLTGYLGLNLVLTLVQISGAFAAVTVTTCRKAVSVAVSFLLFSKPFTMQYVWSGLLVLLALYLNMNKGPNIIPEKWSAKVLAAVKNFFSKKKSNTKYATTV